MTGRSPARLLAPVALVATAIALFAVIQSPGGDDADAPGAAATPAATATTEPERERRRGERQEDSGGTYTVQPGDTPSSIAAEAGVDLDALLAANPGLDANALTVGEELALP